MSEQFVYHPIGIIHSEHTDPAHGPVQPCYADGCLGTVEVFDPYVEGLKDLEGYSHIILLYHCHRARPCPMLVKPFIQDKVHGLFATRMPWTERRFWTSSPIPGALIGWTIPATAGRTRWTMRPPMSAAGGSDGFWRRLPEADRAQCRFPAGADTGIVFCAGPVQLADKRFSRKRL